MDLIPEGLNLSATERDVVELYAQEDKTEDGEQGSQMRSGGREESNFYVGGTTPSNANGTEAGNPGGGEYNEGRVNETDSRFGGILSENGMHITENP